MRKIGLIIQGPLHSIGIDGEVKIKGRVATVEDIKKLLS